ncbi:MAG: hypothetical protein ABIO65_09790 [Nitrospiria bacterium]
MDDPDLPLIERLKAGDTTAIEALFARHRDRLFRFTSPMCRHTHDAEDVLAGAAAGPYPGCSSAEFLNPFGRSRL